MKLSVTKLFWVIVALSVLMRWALILQGGLFFNPDEYRYHRAIDFLHHLKSGDVREALVMFYKYADHNGYMLIAAVPAAMQGVLDVMGIPPERSMKLAAMLLSLFSVANLALVFAIARRTGRSKKEALLAMFLLAVSCTMYRYSRHLLPYDISIFFALLTIYLVHGSRSAKALFGCGVSAFLVFMTYNAFWTLSGLVLVYATVQLLSGEKKQLARLLGGFLLLPLWQFVMAELLGYSYLQSLSNFSATITQGTWSEGWWLGWAYLWHSEHGLLLVWGLGIGLLLASRLERSLLYWLLLVLAMYLLLVLGSVVLQKFVVYGRSMRQLVPFICLLAAAGLMKKPRWIAPIVLLVSIQATWNFALVSKQRFPAELLTEAQGEYQDLSVALAVTGPELHVDESLYGPSRYVLVNHRVLTPVTGTNAVPAGALIFSFPHPCQSKLYQYNGLNAEERQLIDQSDQSIRLIDTQP